MKKLILIFILLVTLLTLCACSANSNNPSSETTASLKSAESSTDNRLLGTWEITLNGKTSSCVFTDNANGYFINIEGTELPFTYKLLNSHQIEQTMVTIDGVEDTSVYEYEINGDKLIFDGLEYSRK